MAQVQVQVTGGAIQQKTATTVGELKTMLSVPNHAASVNGEPADNDYVLTDYEYVALAPAVKGA